MLPTHGTSHTFDYAILILHRVQSCRMLVSLAPFLANLQLNAETLHFRLNKAPRNRDFVVTLFLFAASLLFYH